MRSNHNENEDENRSHRYDTNRPTIPEKYLAMAEKSSKIGQEKNV